MKILGYDIVSFCPATHIERDLNTHHTSSIRKTALIVDYKESTIAQPDRL